MTFCYTLSLKQHYWSCIVMVVLLRSGEIPVPIPNTEVKPITVDDTSALRWESR